MRAARPVLRRIALYSLAAFACTRMCAHAQVDLYSLEAAYIYNFTEFTEWPATPAGGAALTVCVSAHSPMGATLAKLDGRAVAGRTWSVKPIADNAALPACNVLIVDDPASNALAKAAPALPILVVRTADSDGGDSRCIIALIREGDRLRFDIDNTEAVRRRLGLSSKLLRLARNVT